MEPISSHRNADCLLKYVQDGVVDLTFEYLYKICIDVFWVHQGGPE